VTDANLLPCPSCGSPDHDLATKALSAAMALNNALGALLAATDATERACAEHAARAVRAEIARQFAAEEDEDA
jgi:uncharacterized protein (UPF0212 family)